MMILIYKSNDIYTLYHDYPWSLFYKTKSGFLKNSGLNKYIHMNFINILLIFY